jgi:hypothetical protein
MISSNTPVFIRNIAVNGDRINLMAAVPLICWPRGCKLPNHRSSSTADNGASLETGCLTDYVMPAWQKEMPLGPAKYAAYLEIERKVKTYVLEHVKDHYPELLRGDNCGAVDRENGWRSAGDFWLTLPSAGCLMAALGLRESQRRSIAA